MKEQSIRSILFKSFLLLVAVVLGLTLIVFGSIQFRMLNEREERNLGTQCTAIAESLEREIDEMDGILLYSIASREMKEAFRGYLKADSAFEKNKRRQELEGIMISLKGFDFSVRQLNLYNMTDTGFGVGNYNGVFEVSIQDLPWYTKAVVNKGRRYIFAPGLDPLCSLSAGVDEDTPYLSVCRMYYGDFHKPMGFVEVKKYYKELFSFISSLGVERDVTVAVYDSAGRQFYPAEKVFDYYGYRGLGNTEVTNTLTGRRQYVCFAEGDDDEYTVTAAVDRGELMAPVYRTIAVMALIMLIIFAVCFIVALTLSRRISVPIKNIYDFLLRPKNKQFEKLELKNTGIREIDKLKDSLNESITAQEAATQTLLVMQEKEMQARMLALQSQMNPHFLYNSLSTIGEMADEGMSEQVSAMCEDITSILRYISSDREQRIRVEEEMEQADRYLRCMKRRYGDELSYSFDIEDDILDCMIPKLCVQLLVENAVKSVTRQRSPWKVHVSGHQMDDKWEITVSDNGPGFDPEVDKDLRSSMDDILETGVLPGLEIEGMGILNIFIRLYLLDGIPFVFDFGNREEGGAFVTVGGYGKNKDQ